MERSASPPTSAQPRRSPRLRRLGFRLIAFFAASASATQAGASPWYFDIDPTRSIIQVAATVELADFGVSIPTVGQGSRGLGIPSFGDGTSGQFDGFLVGDVNLSAGTLSMSGGTLLGLASGQWEPGLNGETGLEPAFWGVMLEDLLGVPARAVGALRDVRADYFAAGAPTTLEPLDGGVNRYQFLTNEWLAIAANLDVQGQSGLATFLGSQRFDLYERYAARNQGQPGTLAQSADGDWEIAIPLDISLFLESGDNTPVGQINLNFHVQGQIVGRAIPPPEPPPIVRGEAGNDSHETAQPVDGFFTRSFDSNFTDGLVNTSLTYLHATIEATGDSTFDYYHFTIDEAGALGLFDLEGASFSAGLFLFDGQGNLLASSTGGALGLVALGAEELFETHLGHAFSLPGEYTIAVGQSNALVYNNELIGSGPPAGATYTLRISVVPEASSVILLVAAALGAAGIRRFRSTGRQP